MAALPKSSYVSPQEYLECEREADTKSEYEAGCLVAMAGASPLHNTITFNLAVEIGAQLKGTPCRGFVSDLRLRVPAYDRYYYPDLIVVCGEPQYEDAIGLRSQLNPALIIETLSDSTEAKDRGEKLACYQTLDSLSAYVLAAQDRPRIEVFTRQANGVWLYEAITGLDGALTLEAVHCTLRLADVYALVEFPPDGQRSANADADLDE